MAKTLRITGVIKIMNTVRKQLAAGITPDEADAFRRLVNNTLMQVEGICSAAGQKPVDLPAPTYRAYCYLKELDLKHLPVPGKNHSQPPATVRIANLVANCNRLHESLWKLAGDPQNPNLSKKNPQVEAWSKEIAEWVRYLDHMVTKSGPRPVALTAQAKRAYQWLSFLNDPANLEAHLAALHRLAKSGREPGLRQKLPRQVRNLELKVSFYNIPVLYKLKVHKGKLSLTASEGFIVADEKILRALVGSAFQAQGSYLAKVRQYAVSEEFSEVLLDLETATAGELQSDHSDPRLEASFERVNRQLFGGRLAKPRLTWNQTITHRKFGHYLYATDTVMVSVSLDRPDVPAYVLDFIMYHELLHKDLGLKTVNGRNYGHTPEFRQAERSYPKYKEAQDYLERISKEARKPGKGLFRMKRMGE
jgi:hypothetical protein